MGLKSFLKGLTGAGDGADNNSGAGIKQGESVTYLGYIITPAPQPADGQFRIAGSISKAADGNSNTDQVDENTHEFIRADMSANWDDACAMTVDKAKRIIDERGAALLS